MIVEGKRPPYAHPDHERACVEKLAEYACEECRSTGSIRFDSYKVEIGRLTGSKLHCYRFRCNLCNRVVVVAQEEV